MKPPWGETYLRMLGKILEQQNITGEILLAEKAVLLLDIHHREVSKDIDAYFSSGNALREAAQLIAEQEGLPLHWLDQAIESCLPGYTQSDGATYPGLHIYVAPPGYLLTMSLLFGNDQTVRELIKMLGISTAAEIFSLVKAYLPEQELPSRVQGKIEQTFAA